MSREVIEFYLSPCQRPFGGFSREYEKAKYVLLGVPYDSTSSYRPGTRFAPPKIREVSGELETFDVDLGLDYDDLMVSDVGDLSIVHDVRKLTERIRRVVGRIVLDGKVPIIMGGEHTVTLGGVQGVEEARSDLLCVVLDAHADMRDEYPTGEKFTHATVGRRIVDVLGAERVVMACVRALSREEHEYIVANDLRVLYMCGRDVSLELRELVRGREVYLSVDMDVLDPGIAPGVGNPEPGGLSFQELLRLVGDVILGSSGIAGVDVVEVNPLFDCGDVTSVYAAKLIMELILYVESRRSSRA